MSDIATKQWEMLEHSKFVKLHLYYVSLFIYVKLFHIDKPAGPFQQ